MKIRILNAGHQVLANAGELLGLATIADCMADAHVSAFWRKVEMDEIVPHVSAVPGMTPEAYVSLIESRFSNPAIRDTTRRVAFDGSSRHAGFVLPILKDGLAAGSPISGLALVEALWARMCDGTREDGSRIEPNDPAWDRLQPRAEAARKKPGAWLEQTEIYADLGTNGRFAPAFEAWSSLIRDKGTRAALETYVARGAPL
jgi:mannitol 2-dehydrogenase